MRPADVLLALIEAGAVLWVERDRLCYRAPTGALDEGLRSRATRCRRALMALIQAGAVLPVTRSEWDADAAYSLKERAGFLIWDAGMERIDAEREAERLVRLAHTRDFLGRAAMLGSHAAARAPDPAVVTPAAAVATRRPGSDPHRRP